MAERVGPNATQLILLQVIVSGDIDWLYIYRTWNDVKGLQVPRP